MGGIGTCKQIANKYGNGAAHYNTNAINVAKAVHKETNCPLCARDTGENQYWPVLFYGRDLADSADGVFSYKMREPLMEAIKALEERGVFQEMKEANKEFDKNLILYGPPGTGKTYNSATYAVAICDGKSVDELTDYDAVMKRYNELKEAGRIAFTTFHQSYGYEEFIEGIKPVVDDEATDISYTIESGVFKKFCDIAGTPENMEIDHNAQVWFVRLNGVGKNDLKEECFKEGTIRFSWENENVDDSYKKWFNMMSPGDYVVSYNGANVNIDGIGIIEDSEPFYDEQRSSFKWTRKVKWLVTDIVENIRELNGGKYLPNFEITKLNRVRISELLELVSKHGGYAGEKNEKPYVFIIDEINRGNISKIFGELITLIESTKRAGMEEAASAILPYSGKPFSVPSNVYILGTMNTADRSIALMDTALRRRFQFIEMMPDSDVLRKIHADKVEDLDVAAMLDKINERITFLYDREHTIGHAFFTGLHRAAGPELLAECRTLHGCETGEAKITKAYNLPCDYVIHTVGPIWNGGRNREEELLANCYFNSMKLAMDNGIRSIAFPSISTGAYGFPVELAANIAVHTVNRFLQDNLNSFDLVEWVLFDTYTELVYEAAEKSYMEDESDDFDF